MRENRVSGLMRGGCGLLRWLAAFYSNITEFLCTSNSGSPAGKAYRALVG